MKKYNVLCITAASLLLIHPSDAEPQPNILFLFADDLSYEAIGASQILDIDTPNLDTLVERGASFTHAYNMGAWNGAVCMASRAMLNTGRSVWHAQTANVRGMAKENRTWSQQMQQAGYRTYMSGKWHVRCKAESVFDVVKHERGGMPKQTEAGYNRPLSEEDYERGWKPWETKYGGFWEGGTHWSVVLADDGIEFLEQAAADDKPFFMYLAFNAGHDPRQAPKEYIDRYPLERIKLPENFLPEYPDAEAVVGKQLRDERLMPYPRTEYAVKVNRQEYFALITHMDDQIGRVLAALEKSGMAENTYIVFTADNGLAVGRHGLAGKQNMYDHSVRVPFMVVGPDVKPGLEIDTPIYLQDIMPTSLQLAGASVPADVDFQSLLPLLHGETGEHYKTITGAYIGTQRMITSDEWKLIAYPLIKKMKLFNLKNDPQEMTNLALNPEYASVVKRLSTMLEDEMDKQGDPMTSLEAADYPDPNPVITH